MDSQISASSNELVDLFKEDPPQQLQINYCRNKTLGDELAPFFSLVFYSVSQIPVLLTWSHTVWTAYMFDNGNKYILLPGVFTSYIFNDDAFREQLWTQFSLSHRKECYNVLRFDITTTTFADCITSLVTEFLYNRYDTDPTNDWSYLPTDITNFWNNEYPNNSVNPNDAEVAKMLKVLVKSLERRMVSLQNKKYAQYTVPNVVVGTDVYGTEGFPITKGAYMAFWEGNSFYIPMGTIIDEYLTIRLFANVESDEPVQFLACRAKFDIYRVFLFIVPTALFAAYGVGQNYQIPTQQDLYNLMHSSMQGMQKWYYIDSPEMMQKAGYAVVKANNVAQMLQLLNPLGVFLNG